MDYNENTYYPLTCKYVPATYNAYPKACILLRIDHSMVLLQYPPTAYLGDIVE